MAADAEAGSRSGFFAARWRGEVDIGRLFWVDMLLVATLINVAAAYASLMAFGFKAPVWVAVGIYLLPLPYNVFLSLSAWRTADRAAPSTAAAYRLATLAWLAISVLI